MAKPKSRVRKKSKNFNFKSPVFIVFLLAIVGLGIFIIFQSFASDGEIGAAKLLVSKSQEAESVGDDVLLQAPRYQVFSLYDNGLAICGDYPEADKKHNLPYYSKTLTPQERDNFVASIVATGFMKLQSQYPDLMLYSKNTYSITVSSTGSTRKVVAMEGVSDLPESYKKTNAIITGFCNGLNVPYEPQEIVLSTKIIPTSAGKKVDSVLDPEVPVPTDDSVKTQSVKGANAKKLYKSHGKNGEKFSNSSKGIVQSVVTPLLPPAQTLEPNKDLLPSTKSSYETPFMVDKARAAASDYPPTKFYRFCPKDLNCPELYTIGLPSLDTLMNDVNGWYANKLGVAFNVKNNGLLQGLHDQAWYVTYNPVVNYTLGSIYTSFTGGAPAPSLAQEYVYFNIYYEMFYEKKWAPDSPRVIVYQGSLNQFNLVTNACGTSTQPSTSNLVTNKVGRPSVIFYKDAPYCSKTIRQTVAHEMGHGQSLGHVDENDIVSNYQLMHTAACMNSYLNTVSVLSGCEMYEFQRRIIQQYSPFVDTFKIK